MFVSFKKEEEIRSMKMSSMRERKPSFLTLTAQLPKKVIYTHLNVCVSVP